ncbi:MAG: UPF0158 family protein [Ignavibacteriaceae bacterium]|nr:UPF0158 family protein [Ignavibacteriaceae bacterium]
MTKEHMKNGDKIILTEEQIKSIAEELEAGFKVYLNIETMQTKSILDFDNNYDADTEPWEEDIKEIEENYDKYLEFDKMDSRESFQVMEEFIVTVDDEELRKKLELGLSKSKPFRNFKNIIDDENEYRKNWFAFRSAKYIEFVKEQLERYNNNLHSST